MSLVHDEYTLKQICEYNHISQRSIADAVGISKAALNQLLNKGIYPVKQDRDTLNAAITKYLKTHLVQDSEIEYALSLLSITTITPAQKDDPMLLRKQNLTPTARKTFGLIGGNPFTDDVQSATELHLSPDVRYVRESMLHTAKNGGFIAVVGESGAGKTTLRRDITDRIQREKLNIILIEPYVLAAEDNDTKGKTLKSSAIAEAILYALSPLTSPKRSPQARFSQVHTLLKESSRAGNQHVIVIEEAHSLPLPTLKHLKHLKRFFELEDGYRKLISIILIGQNELAMKLSEGNQEVREVVQRCEIVTLEPLTRESLSDYLAHRCKATHTDINSLIDSTGIDAIADRLSPTAIGRNKTANSLLYPLAIGNLITGALNAAAELGAPLVTRDVVMGV